MKDRQGQIVLVLRGGGGLGSYQAGVDEALHEAGIGPDWIFSIGAVKASLIAGNEPQHRLAQLRAAREPPVVADNRRRGAIHGF